MSELSDEKIDTYEKQCWSMGEEIKDLKNRIIELIDHCKGITNELFVEREKNCKLQKEISYAKLEALGNNCNVETLELQKGKTKSKRINVHKLNKKLQASFELEDYEKVAQLIKEGANPDVEVNYFIRDYSSETEVPLISVSVLEEDEHLFKTLVSKGADINKTTFDNDSPLHFAVENDNLEMAARLLDLKAHMDKLNNDDMSPIHMAVNQGNKEMVDLLISHQVSLDFKGDNYWTPLHFAVDRNYLEIVKILVTAGADLEIAADYEGITPMRLAERKQEINNDGEYDEIVEYFRSF